MKLKTYKQILGDFHLDKPKPYPDYLQVAKKTVLSCLDYAEENGIKNIVILGDLFDTPYPSDSAKIALLEIFDRSFEFFVILGNVVRGRVGERCSTPDDDVRQGPADWNKFSYGERKEGKFYHGSNRNT